MISARLGIRGLEFEHQGPGLRIKAERQRSEGSKPPTPVRAEGRVSGAEGSALRIGEYFILHPRQH